MKPRIELALDEKPRQRDTPTTAPGATPRPGEAMAVALVESKPTIPTNRRRHDEPLAAAVQGALQMLELSRHIMLANSNEPRKVPRGHWAVEQRGADALPHGSLPSLVNDVLHGVSR
jgi:hypothetical protein